MEKLSNGLLHHWFFPQHVQYTFSLFTLFLKNLFFELYFIVIVLVFSSDISAYTFVICLAY